MLNSLTLDSNKKSLTGYQLQYHLKKLNHLILIVNEPCLKFSNSVLERKSSSSLYRNFILISYIVYELNNWPHNLTNNFPLKNCLFGTVKLVRNAIKNEFIYNG